MVRVTKLTLNKGSATARWQERGGHHRQLAGADNLHALTPLHGTLLFIFWNVVMGNFMLAIPLTWNVAWLNMKEELIRHASHTTDAPFAIYGLKPLGMKPMPKPPKNKSKVGHEKRSGL